MLLEHLNTCEVNYFAVSVCPSYGWTSTFSSRCTFIMSLTLHDRYLDSLCYTFVNNHQEI